jgi:Putative pectate lyase-like adhesive domain
MSTPTRLRRSVAALGATMLLAAGGAVATVGLVAAPAGATTVSNESEFRDAWANDAEINLSADITLTCDGGRADRDGTADDFTLDGQGHTITQTCAGDGVLEVGSRGGNGVVRHVTLTGGSNTTGGEYGAGLFFDSSSKNLTLDHVAIVGNTNCTDGGGLDYEGSEGAALTITHSTIADNVSGGFGGAAWASADGAVITIENSTLSGNTAAFFGATATSGTDLTLTYATIVQNGTATGPDCEQPIPEGSTTHGAEAGADEPNGAIDTQDATVTAFGTVVALPQGGVPNCLGNEGTTVTSEGYNFSDDASCGFTGTGDRENAGDPGLGALGANGGYAPTMVPQPGSPLLDAIPVAACQTGSAAGVTTDERDATRPQGTGCDIGAVEVEVVAPAPAVITPPRFTG